MAKPEDKTVLVVDDEEDVREYLTMALEDAGFEVQMAANGNEALEKIRERAPDFISLDLVMPEKSGIKLLHELRRNRAWRNIPFVIVTAHAGDDLGKGDLEEIMSQKTFSGPSAYLEKPVKPEQYVAFVCEQLGIEGVEGTETKDVDLREQLQELIDSADKEKLAEALKILREK